MVGMLEYLMANNPFAQPGGGFGQVDAEAARALLPPDEAAAAEQARMLAAGRLARGAKRPPVAVDSPWPDQAPAPAVGPVAGLLSGMTGLGGPSGWADQGPPMPPPATNDPTSGEPKPDGDAMPLQSSQGFDEAGFTGPAPLSLAPPARDDGAALPAGATSTQGRAPAALAAPAESGLFSGAKGILDKIFDPNKAATMVALGAGFAGAPSIGTGMRRAFSNAVPAMAADRSQIKTQEGAAATYRALIAKGVPPHEALAASQNPILMKAVADKYFDDQLVPHEIGTDRYGNKLMGSFHKRSGKYYDTSGREVKPAEANTGQPPDGGGLSGDAFLKTLPDQKYADKVRAIAEGREPFPQGQIMRSPYGRKLGEDVLAFDPSFDAVNYGSREKTRKDFTSGKSAANLTSFNTTISHLDSLARAAEKLENTNFPLWNTLANKVAGSYDPKFQAAAKEFQAARTAVADELTRSFRGSGGNVHDIKAWEATINAADSPAALRSAIKQAAELLRGRIDAVGDQYNRGMNTTKDPLELLNPKSAEAFKRLHEQDVQTGPGKDTAAPKLKPGEATTINGVTIRRLN